MYREELDQVTAKGQELCGRKWKQKGEKGISRNPLVAQDSADLKKKKCFIANLPYLIHTDAGVD